jgi:hypothetical protein
MCEVLGLPVQDKKRENKKKKRTSITGLDT